jgi:ketosteroid isomerase-like protein
MVRHKPYVTPATAELISYVSIILSIIYITCLAVPQFFAQENPAIGAPSLTDNKTFQQIEDRWSEAINKRDQYVLELVLSPELIDVSATGNVTTRNQQIAMLFQKGAEPLSLDQRVVNVQSFGDIAIVIGSYVEQLSVNEKLVRRSGMFTHIYRKFRGSWSCISVQRTLILEPEQRKRKR